MKLKLMVTIGLIIFALGGAIIIAYGLGRSADNDKSIVTDAACGKTGGACSSSEVAEHNNQLDCWVIYDGYYYDVTSFVSSHEGGSSVFNSSTCGSDITGYLNGSKSSAGVRNSHSQAAYTLLEKYLVGPVSE